VAGLDLNWKRSDMLKYAVLVASQDTTPGAGALAGRFVGGKGSVTMGYGGGADAQLGIAACANEIDGFVVSKNPLDHSGA
jgi:hypothetical protein